MAELLSLIENLTTQLTSWGQHEGQGVSLPTPSTRHEVGQGDISDDGKAECSRFP